MTKFIFTLFVLCCPFTIYSQFSVTGVAYVEEKSNISEVKQIFVCQNLNQAVLSYSFTGSSSEISCWQYSRDNKKILPYSDYTIQSGQIIFNNLKDEFAYGVKKGSDDISFAWIIDYSWHQLNLQSLNVEKSDDECSITKLIINAEVPLLAYYSPSGYFREISRNYTLSYETLTWSKTDKKFTNESISTDKGIRIPETLLNTPPLKNTTFKISGDQFLTAFGKQQTIECPYSAVAVSGVAIATQIENPSDNQLSKNTSETEKTFIAMPIDGEDSPIIIEGSAPLNLDLQAIGTTPTAFSYTWEIATDADYLDLEAQFTDIYPLQGDAIFRYPFEKAGTFYVRLITSNQDNSCESITNSFKITVYDSKLEVPNAFSPGSDGINDVFKVAYQSIIKFKAWVFNRWGNQLYHWNDPAGGWDGTFNGQIVPPGVYFYVIEAEGSDGRKYKLKGDINLFHESKK
ncbi:MAG: gliding motility-associated C-terminal domain-containing protein [Bacteroidales bacterium]